jgi:hypothetical protein
MSSTAAITARMMCLKDLITISWMHIDWMCGSFAASSTWLILKKQCQIIMQLCPNMVGKTFKHKIYTHHTA